VQGGLKRLREAHAQAHPDAAKTARARNAFDWVAECASGLASAEFPPDVLDVPAAQTALAENLDALFHGRDDYDREALAFIKQHALNAVAVAFRDELARDGEAWQRYHGWLIEGLAAGAASLGQSLARFDEVLSAFRDEGAALNALTAGMAKVDATTLRIDETTARIEGKVDALREGLAKLDQQTRPPTAGPFANQTIHVQGHVYQAQNITLNNGQLADGNATAEATTPASPSLRLYAALQKHFNLQELRGLCFELHINWENLSGDALNAKCRELVEFCERHDRLAELRAAVLAKRPQAKV
jgi:hypothetical protein